MSQKVRNKIKMKNIAMNNVNYSGKVKLKLQDEGITLQSQEIDNSGTSNLFTFLAYCLMGEFEEASLYLPTKVRLLKANIDAISGEELDVEPSSGYVFLRSPPERIYKPEIDGETVKLSFMIPRTMIESIGFNRIALYPQFATDTQYYEYSAYCDLSGVEDLGIGSYTAWTLSSVLLIDWELTISNKIMKVKDTSGGNT